MMRVLVNANLGYVVGRVLEKHGHDVVYAAQQLPQGATDPDIARWATAQQRHIITTDRGFRRELQIAGIVFTLALVTLEKVRPANPSDYADLLAQMLEQHPQWQPQTHYLVSPRGIRIRSL